MMPPKVIGNRKLPQYLDLTVSGLKAQRSQRFQKYRERRKIIDLSDNFSYPGKKTPSISKGNQEIELSDTLIQW